MGIILCEAAHDELGQLGYETHQKGDQTGDEVRNYNYYNKPWSYVFRFRNKDMANAFAIRMQQAVNNENIGYGQPARLDYFYALPAVNYDPSKITKKCDCDCSALVNANVYYTLLSCGIKTAITGHETTAMMPEAYRKSSAYFEDVTSKIDLATGKGLQKGDILVRPMSHTAAVWYVGEEKKQEEKKESTKKNVTGNLYLRESPVTGKAICVMPKGSTVNVINMVTASNGSLWSYVEYESYTGYCSNKYLESTSEKTMTVTTALYLRKEPVNGAVICVMPKDAKVILNGKQTAQNGTVWYLVSYGNNTGWASSKYIK